MLFYKSKILIIREVYLLSLFIECKLGISILNTFRKSTSENFQNYWLYLLLHFKSISMLKSLFNWKVLLNLVLAIGVFTGLVWLTFRWLEYHTSHGQEIPVPNVVNMTVHNAIKILDDSGMEYEVDSFKYDPRYKPFQVLQIYPAPGSRVKAGRTVIMKVNPRTWAKVSVPDIIDRYKGLAFRQLEQVGLKVGDTLYEPSIQRDAVLRMVYNGTNLKPGTLLPRFSTIDLVIGAGPKRNITIPNLVGLTVQQAKQIIAQNLFEVGLVEFEDDARDESDIVYYQDPEAFDIRDQGMQIDLWASKRTPAEMGAKIEQLNSIYRVKIDTTVPATVWDEPVHISPVPAPVTKPKEPETETTEVKKETSKSAEKPANEDKNKTSANNKNTATATKTTNSDKPKKEEAPKKKKVVVE